MYPLARTRQICCHGGLGFGGAQSRRRHREFLDVLTCNRRAPPLSYLAVTIMNYWQGKHPQAEQMPISIFVNMKQRGVSLVGPPMLAIPARMAYALNLPHNGES